MKCRELGKLCNEQDVKSTSSHYAGNAIYTLFIPQKNTILYLFMHMYRITSFIPDGPLLAKIVCPIRWFYHYPSISTRQIGSRISRNIRQSDCPYCTTIDNLQGSSPIYLHSNLWRLRDCYFKYRDRCLTMQQVSVERFPGGMNRVSLIRP